ncbi:MAG: hypothetical protein HYS41_01370 [Candidatus Omnitrophica bacterium]|nr:hypothetical protein [Candidatus Omnitrophota bacterium]
MSEPIVVTSPAHLRRALRGRTDFKQWLYLGKNVRFRAQAQAALGLAPWDSAQKLHETARALRQPFLDLVAQVGAGQEDPITWWSTRLSWKMWIASDLFLLACYLHLAHDEVTQAIKRHEALLIVVEDPWLLRQLQENLGGADSRIRVVGESSLLAAKGRVVAAGLLKRVRWLIKTLSDRRRQRRVWPSRERFVPRDPAIALFSYPQPSSFKGPRQWEDHHLPGMEELLAESGWDVVRFSSPDCGGYERPLAMRSDYFQPLILWATRQAIWRSFKAMTWPGDPLPLTLGGRPVTWLIHREQWLEVGRASLCAFRLFYETASRLLEKGNWRWVVYSYENQPWEKLLVLAAQAHGVRTAAYQAIILSEFYLPYFLGKGEAQRMPLPDIIFTSGPYGHRLLQAGGIPPGKLRLTGSIRYRELSSDEALGACQGNGRQPRGGNILVALPIDPPMAAHLLEALRLNFPGGGQEEGLRFWIRHHPLHPIRASEIRFPARLLPADFTDLKRDLKEADLVLFTASSVGFQALAMGKRVVNYRSGQLLDVGGVYPHSVPMATDTNLRQVVLEEVGNLSSPKSDSSRPWVTQVFSPYDPQRVQSVLGSPRTAAAAQEVVHV